MRERVLVAVLVALWVSHSGSPCRRRETGRAAARAGPQRACTPTAEHRARMRAFRARLALYLRALLRADRGDLGPMTWHGPLCSCRAGSDCGARARAASSRARPVGAAPHHAAVGGDAAGRGVAAGRGGGPGGWRATGRWVRTRTRWAVRDDVATLSARAMSRSGASPSRVRADLGRLCERLGAPRSRAPSGRAPPERARDRTRERAAPPVLLAADRSRRVAVRCAAPAAPRTAQTGSGRASPALRTSRRTPRPRRARRRMRRRGGRCQPRRARRRTTRMRPRARSAR